METIALLAFPAAIIMAVGAFFVDKNRAGICTTVSFVCCAIPAIYGFFNVKKGIDAGEMEGLAGMYPVMSIFVCVLFAVVTVINVLAYTIRRRK